MSVLNQNDKLQTLNDSVISEINGGFTTHETADGRFVNLVDHSGIYSCLESAQTAANAICSTSSDCRPWCGKINDLKPIQLVGGNWGLMLEVGGTYSNKDDADAAGKALERISLKH